MDRSDLANRMKTFYEQIPKTKLMRRCPVICRLDGRSFHTFTRGFQRPFDEVLIKTMQQTAKYLCENIQGAQLAYTQSDEVSVLLIDYKRLNSDAWFDYEVQKMCSVAASMATMVFNKLFSENARDFKRTHSYPCAYNENDEKLIASYGKALDMGAMFDARVFNIPREEVSNYFYWRQLDATRNSIQMVGQANFSHSELHEKTCNDIQDMLMTQKKINWNDFPAYLKRGSCVVKSKFCWIIDKNIPIFKGEDRNYIEQFVYVGEE